MKAIVLRTNGLAELVDFPETEDRLEWYYKTIGCDIIDIVDAHGVDYVAETYGMKSLLNKFCLVVDDEGLLKEDPKINVVASLLYGYDDHGQPLCGDVLFAKNVETDDGLMTVGFDEGEVVLAQVVINSLIERHNEKVKE